MVKSVLLPSVIFSILFGCILPLTGCSPEEVAASSELKAAVVVTYMPVRTEAITLTAELPGRISAQTVSEVRPQVSGIILERLFEEGSEVQKGDVLYQIEPSVYQAEADSAKAALSKTKADLNAADKLVRRYEQLVQAKAISIQQYDDAVAAQEKAAAEVEEARAHLDRAQINLEFTKVRAPIAGRAGRSSVTPGALVTQNQPEPLVQVHDISSVYVDVSQSSNMLMRLRRSLESGNIKTGGPGAMRVYLKYDDGTYYAHTTQAKDSSGKQISQKKPIAGDLKFSEITVDQSTGTIAIRAVFPNPEAQLLPGMYVHALVEEGSMDKAVVVPQKAVARDSRGQAVVRVLMPAENEGLFQVVNREVVVERPIGQSWLISEGLAADDFLVLEGVMKLRPGEPVRAVSVNTANPSATDALAALSAGR